MAAALKQELGVETELSVGNSGEFTVWVNGECVADKAKGSAFPEPSAVVAKVRARLPG